MKYGFLILAFVICLKPAFPFLEYAVNYDYINKVLCINKDKPEVHCYGKCYLMKAVKAEAENDHKDKPTEKFEYQLLFFQDRKETTPFIFRVGEADNTYHPAKSYASIYKELPFKPPISSL